MKYILIALAAWSVAFSVLLQAQTFDDSLCLQGSVTCTAQPLAPFTSELPSDKFETAADPAQSNTVIAAPFALLDDLAGSFYRSSEAKDDSSQCAGVYQLPDGQFLASGSDNKGAEVLRANLNRLSGQLEAELVLQGDVNIAHGHRRLAAALAEVNLSSQTVGFPQGVRISQPDLVIQGERAEIETSSGLIRLDDVQMLLADVGLRGRGASMSQSLGGDILLRQGEFTRCEPKNNSWSISAKSVRISDGDVFATTRGAVLRISSLPVFYAPYLRVPINEQRQTGLLTPAIGYSSEDGLDLALPYYFNIASNLDATLAPRVMAQRGVGLEGQLRYLTVRQRSSIDVALLPSDDLYNGVIDRRTFQAINNGSSTDFNLPRNFEPVDRWLGAVDHFGQFGQIRTRIDFSKVSDRDYFQDIDSNLGVGSPIDLQRHAQLAYISPKLELRLTSQSFQRLDNLSTESYERSPQLSLKYNSDIGQSIASFDLHAEWADFERSSTQLTGLDSAEGSRLHIEPSIIFGQHKNLGFWSAKAGLRYSQYKLNFHDLAFADSVADTSPSREISYLSLDAGLFFDRPFTFAGLSAVQTLEPRIYYFRQGFEDQDHLPVFDSTSLSIDYAQLFRNNRFVGLDRIADADQLTIGVTSRFLSSTNGREVLSMSIGQVEQFSDSRVKLLNNPLANRQPQGSALAGEVSAQLSPRWRIIANEVWDYEDSRWQELGATLGYRGDNKHLFNIGFRKRAQEDVEQAELSVYWPIGKKLGVMARWHYDVNDNSTMEGFTGLEYDDCCLRARLMLRQSLHHSSFSREVSGYTQNPLLRTDKGVYLQVVFKGLAGFGNKIDKIMERGIRGYRPVSQ